MEIEKIEGTLQKSNKSIIAKMDNMTKQQYQMFYYILSKLNSSKKISELKEEDFTFSFNANELKKAMNVKRLDYSILEKVFDSLGIKRIEYKKTNKKNSWSKKIIFKTLTYDNGNISGKMNNEILDYWFDFGKHNTFTTLKISHTSQLSTKYGLLLYELLEMDKWKGNNVTFDLDLLHLKLHSTDSKKKRFDYFKEKTLKPALRDIKNKIGLDIELDLIRENRKVVKVSFKIKKGEK